MVVVRGVSGWGYCVKHSAVKFVHEFLCDLFSALIQECTPGRFARYLCLSKVTTSFTSPRPHQVRAPQWGLRLQVFASPSMLVNNNSLILRTVMTLSEQGCLNKRHGNTACWEHSSSTRASHGWAWGLVQPPSWGSPSPPLQGPWVWSRLPPGVTDSAWSGPLHLNCRVLLSPKVLPALQNMPGAFLRMLVLKAGSAWFSSVLRPAPLIPRLRRGQDQVPELVSSVTVSTVGSS